MEEEKKAGYKWLMIVFGSVALLAIGAYTWNFWGWPPSGKTQDWANFATYISGTLGVAAVVATLAAFMITIKQQQALIRQQRIQIEQADKHQERLSAYQRASELLPSALKVLDSHLHSFLGNSFDSHVFEVFGVTYITERYLVFDFFRDDRVLAELMREELLAQVLVGNFITEEPYKLARFVAGILQDAPDLHDIVMMQLKDYVDVLNCSMSYQRKNKKLDEWNLISSTLCLPKIYSSLEEPHATWRALGHDEKGEDTI